MRVFGRNRCAPQRGRLTLPAAHVGFPARLKGQSPLLDGRGLIGPKQGHAAGHGLGHLEQA
jgi:hypothetical protein